MKSTIVFLCASVSLAVFPKQDGFAPFKMQQGWFGGGLAWFICTDTEDIRFAMTQNLTLAPLLHSAVDSVPVMYIVRNPPTTQGPIFSSHPLISSYAGLVDVSYVDWNPGFTKVTITSEGQITALMGAGAVTVTDADIILDCPIVALGPLGGPWSPAPPGLYRIKQGQVASDYAYTKTIRLPFFDVFCSDVFTKQVQVVHVIIPDAGDAMLADLLGANLALGLSFVDPANTQPFWVTTPPMPPSQMPVIKACPNAFGWRNTEFNYTPIMQFTVLNRLIPPSAVVNNDQLVEALISNGGLTVASSSQRINAPVVPSIF